ncbi:hypothetical protein, partial [Mesoflavibacter zeaxanthinifaciens]|uniref:hypothetical protein n=1 Tax=Mesoflavibacter zeaxanthinifaciens TaxID=393060 RepID=UPI003A934441
SVTVNSNSFHTAKNLLLKHYLKNLEDKIEKNDIKFIIENNMIINSSTNNIMLKIVSVQPKSYVDEY